MENQSVTSVVILNLSTAFDTVDHDLLEVLENQFGITGSARQWYHNYLKPRKFKVEIGQEKYKTRQLEFSVPQGSIQGAFLFITYASTLDDLIDNLILNGFADDHSVRKTFKLTRLDHTDELDTVKIIEKAMLDINVWMDQGHLKWMTVKHNLSTLMETDS